MMMRTMMIMRGQTSSASAPPSLHATRVGSGNTQLAGGPVVHVISFHAAISACKKGGQWQRVAPLHDAMRKGWACHSTRSASTQPS
eukprot:4500295-Karenia_brevis.AAC.1